MPQSVVCNHCNSAFIKSNSDLAKTVNNFCSHQCYGNFFNIRNVSNCGQCDKPVIRKNSQFKKSKSGFTFCSRSCSVTFHNTHKTTGNRRSKLETWLQSKLLIMFETLPIEFNNKTAINSELDIYFPSISLAVELNGIFHYEPIYGPEKFNQIKTNDTRKFQACLENNIELLIIDTSSQKYFKESTSIKYLEIICEVVNYKLQRRVEESNS